MISPKLAYRLSLLAGLFLLVLIGIGAGQKEAHVCGNLASNYPTIIAFELARSVSDLHAIFGDSAGACRTEIAQQMDAINWNDSLVFIPAYGAFLIFFFLGLRSRDARLGSIAVGITVLACAADYVENSCLFHLSVNPDVASSWLSLLAWATEVKWVGLGIVNGIAGYVLFASRRFAVPIGNIAMRHQLRGCPFLNHETGDCRTIPVAGYCDRLDRYSDCGCAGINFSNRRPSGRQVRSRKLSTRLPLAEIPANQEDR